MASRKEDEKNEKIIRGLTKLPENRRCINCGSLGPQYVCTNFAIFICTTCSGLHREFTHRVKSISMAHFTPAEVAALQGGGNQKAREIYFKDWDSGRHSLPDSSNPEKLRDFIKAVYVDRRFSARGRMSDADDPQDARRPDRFKFGQSPSFEDRYEDRRYTRNASRGDRSFEDKMSPRFEAERDRRYDDRERRYDDRDRRSDDRRYDDREFRRYEDRERSFDDRRFDDRDRDRDKGDRRYDDRERRFDYEDRERRPDNNRRASDDWDSRRPARTAGLARGAETPPVRSVRDILGDDVPKLRVEDAPKLRVEDAPKLRVEDNGRSNGRLEDESPRSVSSSQGDSRLRASKSMDAVSSNGSVKAFQHTISESLIDFAADPVPPTQASTTTAFDPFAAAEQPKQNAPFDPFAAPEQPKPNASFDPFAASEPTKPFDPFSAAESANTSTQSDPFGASTGWASFDVSPPKVSGPVSTATTAPTSFFDQPLQTAPQVAATTDWPPQQQSSIMHSWTATGVQPAPAPNFQDQWNSQVQKPQMLHPMPFQPTQPPQAPLEQQNPSSAPKQQQQQPADNGVPRQSSRPEIPEGLFTMPQMPYMMGGMQMHMPPPPPPFGFPQSAPAPPYAPPMPPAPMPSMPPPYPKSKSNPFDLPGESQSFPSLSNLQSTLPSFGGPQSTPAPAVGPGPPPQWSQAAPSFGPPASYGPPSYPGFPGGGFNQQANLANPMQGQFQPPAANGMGFGNGALSFVAAPQVPPPQPAAGGNPFG